MILAVSQRLKLIAENSIIIVSKLVRKAPIRSKIERNTNPRKKKKKKKKETQIEKLKEIYIGNNSAILSYNK